MTREEVEAKLAQASRFLNAGRAHEAAGLLATLSTAAPERAEIWLKLGQARRSLRDAAGAELAFRAVLERQPNQPDAAAGLAALLNAAGRAAEALAVTAPLAEASQDPALLTEHAAALKALGRTAEAIPAYARLAALDPASITAEHNLAAAQADLGRHAEAEAATRRAFAKGGRAAETYLVHAHALQGQDRLDEAEAAYHQALAARPGYLDAHRDLAQLVWMRTADLDRAAAALDRDIQAMPAAAPSLILFRAQLLQHAGREAEAYAAAAALAQRQPHDALVQVAAAQHAVKAGRAAEALAHAEAAAQRLPGDWRTELTLCEALLANGRGEAAAASAARLRALRPSDQSAIALQAAAWRLTGDPRYAALYDYAALVRAYRIDTPPGWVSLDAYLADLAEGLTAMHVNRTHPLGQSLRHGSQTNRSLLNAEHPAIRAFPQAIDGPIRAYMRALGAGEDPIRARNGGDYAIAGLWSVRLRGGGFHVDHVHPEGWISSACYIALPSAVEGADQAGWIRFGQPGTPTAPPLAAEHALKPEPGRLVLFPSYMWHGTVPFTGEEPRLTVAFDLVPKA